MTLSEFPDLYKQVIYLLDMDLQAYMQMIVVFKFDYDKERFSKFAEDYNKD